jgi:predicted Zn-dependent protease
LTDHADTHPCFAERVRALGLQPDQFHAHGFPGKPNPSAAEFLFGESLPGLRREISNLWRDEVKNDWKARHGHAAIVQRQIAAIDPGSTAGQLAPEFLWEKAQKVLSLGGPDEAEPLLRALVATKPDHSAANLVLGQHLLGRLDPEGASYLQRILDAEDDGLIPEACAALTSYFQALGHPQGAQSVRERLLRYQVDMESARKERGQVRASDRFRPHELAPSELDAIIAALRSESALEGAWLVQKDLVFFPKQRLFVVVVQTATNSWGRSNAVQDSQLASRLIPKLKLPGSTLVIGAKGTFGKLAKKVMAHPDAKIV